MNKYVLHGTLKAKKGMGVELATILLDASKLVANSKGCLLYIISKDSLDSDSVWVTEIWDSKGDHDNSLKEPDVRMLISKAMPLIGSTPEKGQELELLGGYGLE